MPSYVSIIVTVVALGLMYAVCIRPMRRGQGHCAGGTRQPDEVQRLREELDRLRREQPAAGGEGATR